RQWVLEEANYGRDRGILVPILIGVDRPPFGFSLIHARNLTDWDGGARATEAALLLADVRHKLGQSAPQPPSQPVSKNEALTPELSALLVASIAGSASQGGVTDLENCLHKPGTGKVCWFKDIDIGPEMVVVPPGEFMMGSNDADNEKPSHKVTIKAPF